MLLLRCCDDDDDAGAAGAVFFFRSLFLHWAKKGQKGNLFTLRNLGIRILANQRISIESCF